MIKLDLVGSCQHPRQGLHALDEVSGGNKETKKVEAGEEIEGGLKNERFKDIGERGIRAQIITNDDGLVTEIRVFARKKKN